MSLKHISTSQLQEMSREHISYEIQMFVFTASKVRAGGMDTLENNAMLETFLLHARCLLDFLYPPATPRSDDVLANDFFEDPSILRRALPATLPMSSYLKSRTGKEVAHLTYERLNVTPTQKVWNFGEIHDQLGKALAIFFTCLTEEQRDWFTTIVR